MKTIGRERRHVRIRRRIAGTELKPRLVIFRSKKHMHAQVINDKLGKVIIVCSTLNKDFKEKKIKSNNKEGAGDLGKLLAAKSLSLGIKEVCFDRAGYKYHGRIKAFADAARDGGLRF